MASKPYSVPTNLRQGGPISPALFNIALEIAVRKISVNPNGTINNRLVHVMAYADDIAIISINKGFFSVSNTRKGTRLRNVGTYTNYSKTKYIRSSRYNCDL